MFYISDKKDIDICQLKKLLEQTFWASTLPVDLIEKSMEHSVNFGAFDKESDELVGFARVVTDYVTLYYICDVIVDAEHRGQGIGKALIDTIVNDDRFVGVPALLKTKDAQGLYSQYGFLETDPGRVMYRPK